jgi:hypothetical protein
MKRGHKPIIHRHTKPIAKPKKDPCYAMTKEEITRYRELVPKIPWRSKKRFGDRLS